MRFRVVGNGTLQTVLRSLNPLVTYFTAPNITMASPTNIEPMILTNFIDQKFQVHCSTSSLDDDFTITRIVAWIKVVGYAHPR